MSRRLFNWEQQFWLMMAIISMWGIKIPLAYVLGIHLGYGGA
ncbi:hypothetical protein [Paenibacillus sp. NPDC055715]